MVTVFPSGILIYEIYNKLQCSRAGRSDTDGGPELHKFSEVNSCQLVRLHNIRRTALEEAIFTLLSNFGLLSAVLNEGKFLHVAKLTEIWGKYGKR